MFISPDNPISSDTLCSVDIAPICVKDWGGEGSVPERGRRDDEEDRPAPRRDQELGDIAQQRQVV